MMTRDELCKQLAEIGNAYKHPGRSCQSSINWIINHDAEQRAEIERFMAEAVKWAFKIYAMNPLDNHEARLFLTSPDVQVWQKRQEEKANG